MKISILKSTLSKNMHIFITTFIIPYWWVFNLVDVLKHPMWHFNILNEKIGHQSVAYTLANVSIVSLIISFHAGSMLCIQNSAWLGGCGWMESWTGTLPDNRCITLADSNVVGRSLHIHTSDGEPCRNKTQESEKRSLQLPPTRSPSDQHFELGAQRSQRKCLDL